MINVTLLSPVNFLAFWLIFTRWLTVIFQVPLISETSVPVRVKVLLSLILSFTFFELVKAPVISEIQYFTLDSIWWLTILYALIGLTIGFMIRIIITLFTSAGSIITQQIGFGSVTMFDPSFQMQVGPFEKLIRWTLIILIADAGGFTPILKGVLKSFHNLQISTFAMSATRFDYFNDFFKNLLFSAVVLASPIIFSNFIMNTILGVIARAVPQLNVMMVSFVTNIGVGLVVFAMIQIEFFNVAYQMYIDYLGKWFGAL